MEHDKKTWRWYRRIQEGKEAKIQVEKTEGKKDEEELEKNKNKKNAKEKKIRQRNKGKNV